MTTQAFLSTGSNTGERITRLDEAARRLTAADIILVERSRFYETEAVDFTGQPPFVNQVWRLKTECSAQQLLERCQAVERLMGRVRKIDKGPRCIDLDIVLFGETILSTPTLQVPHPAFRERRFVLVPLAEIAAETRDPVTGRTIATLLQACSDKAWVKPL